MPALLSASLGTRSLKRAKEVGCVILLLINLTLCVFSIWNLVKSKKEQIESENFVVAILDKYTRILEIIENRQSRLENILITSERLRSKENAIECYNKTNHPKKQN